jgi:hypothetical protein
MFGDGLRLDAQYLFGFCICYGLASPLVKLTFLALYRRIFPTPLVVIGTLVIGCMTIAWCIAIELVTIFQCSPIAMAWNKTLEGKCIDVDVFYLGNSIPNCLMDLAILVLPLYDAIHLKMSLGKRVGVTAIFLLGGM